MDTDPGCYVTICNEVKGIILLLYVTCVCIHAAYNQCSALLFEKKVIHYYRRSGDGWGGGGGEVLTLTVISSLSRGGFSSGGGHGWVGVAASVLYFELGKGCGGRLSSLVM